MCVKELIIKCAFLPFYANQDTYFNTAMVFVWHVLIPGLSSYFKA